MARYRKLGKADPMIGEEASRRSSREYSFGRMADELLAREGLVIDAESPTRLADALSKARGDATVGLYRMAVGDYSPDITAARFSAWTSPEAPRSAPSTDTITVIILFDGSVVYQTDKLAPATLKRYGASLRSLTVFLKSWGLRSITYNDVHTWAEHRRDKDGISPRVVNMNDLRAVQTRERTFRDAEVVANLKAADAVEADIENPTLAFARRWCPWLAAYSGARIAKLTDLERDDIFAPRAAAPFWT